MNSVGYLASEASKLDDKLWQFTQSQIAFQAATNAECVKIASDMENNSGVDPTM
jgi:hypothetical protein